MSVIDDYMEDDDSFDYAAADERRYIVLVIYDIVDDRKRYRMVRFLEGYGIRVQKSAFEARLTKKQYERMTGRIHKLIDKNTDSLRIYFLDNHFAVRSWGIGSEHLDEIIII